MLRGFVKEAAIRDGDVGQAGERAEGTWSAKCARRPGPGARGEPGFLIFVESDGVDDGATSFHIDRVGPRDGRVRLSRRAIRRWRDPKT